MFRNAVLLFQLCINLTGAHTSSQQQPTSQALKVRSQGHAPSGLYTWF